MNSILTSTYVCSRSPTATAISLSVSALIQLVKTRDPTPSHGCMHIQVPVRSILLTSILEPQKLRPLTMPPAGHPLLSPKSQETPRLTQWEFIGSHGVPPILHSLKVATWKLSLTLNSQFLMSIAKKSVDSFLDPLSPQAAFSADKMLTTKSL